MKCTTPYCRNERIKHKTICPKCKSRLYKKRHPEAYFFNLLRCNAKRRGKEFNLTLDEFKEFCKETGYMERKGKNGSSLSIDRIIPSKGYSIDNIRVMSLSGNTIRKNIIYFLGNNFRKKRIRS